MPISGDLVFITFLTISSFSRMIKQTLYPRGAAVLLSLSFSSAQAQTRSELSRTTFETTLSNGLKVIIREDHRAPMVMTQIWYKLGSSDESGNILGVSHALEH